MYLQVVWDANKSGASFEHDTENSNNELVKSLSVMFVIFSTSASFAVYANWIWHFAVLSVKNVFKDYLKNEAFLCGLGLHYKIFKGFIFSHVAFELVC